MVCLVDKPHGVYISGLPGGDKLLRYEGGTNFEGTSSELKRQPRDAAVLRYILPLRFVMQ